MDLKSAIQHLNAGNFPAAKAACEAALSASPNDAEAWNLLGTIQQQAGRSDLAAQSFRRAVDANPTAAGYLNNLGTALRALGRLDDALAAHRRAAALNPKSPVIQFNLGAALSEAVRHDEALAPLRLAAELKPDYADAHNTLGIALFEVGQVEPSLSAFERTVALRPDHASAWSNMANVLRDLGRLEEASAAYRRALSIRIDHADARKNLALMMLQRGEFAAGWLEYEWRWKVQGAQPRQYPQPRWAGEDLSGKTIFVHEEQGFGDVIQFARFAGPLAKRGAAVVFGCRPELERLIAGCARVSRVVVGGKPIGPFDVHCPLLTLPLLLETRLETVPNEVPYFTPPAGSVEAWSQRLGPRTRPRVGLAWAGNPALRSNRLRTLHLSQLVPLARAAGTTGVDFHSLQVGAAAGQAGDVTDIRVHDHAPLLRDFAETAALIHHLDLVISVDTATAHLAGALGKPTWVLIPSAPDWRWLLNREDSPWYPTMRLFRQADAADWTGPIGRMAEELARRFAG